MTLRSSSRVEYWARILFLVLFSLAVYTAVAAYCGWQDVFAFWKPERMRWFLVMGIVWAAAAHEMRPEKVTAQKRTRQTSSTESVAAPASASAGESAEQDAPDAEMPRAEEPDSVTSTEDASAQEPSPDELWYMAREMPHNFVPNPMVDHDYLALVHAAAMAGHAEAQSKLAEYASRRNALVEAYYWMSKAKRNELEGADDFLTQCREQWMENGCLPEYENNYEFFTERQGVLARAALRLTCGVDVEHATQRLEEMIADGDAEAKEFLEESVMPVWEEGSPHEDELSA